MAQWAENFPWVESNAECASLTSPVCSVSVSVIGRLPSRLGPTVALSLSLSLTDPGSSFSLLDTLA